MTVKGYLILEPGADRPYFSHSFPTEYQKKSGAEIYVFELSVPRFHAIDGRIAAVAELVEE